MLETTTFINNHISSLICSVNKCRDEYNMNIRFKQQFPYHMLAQHLLLLYVFDGNLQDTNRLWLAKQDHECFDSKHFLFFVLKEVL